MTTSRKIGRYQVLEEIASGAQGSVYRTIDPATARTVAVKVLTGQRVTDVERLRRERVSQEGLRVTADVVVVSVKRPASSVDPRTLPEQGVDPRQERQVLLLVRGIPFSSSKRSSRRAASPPNRASLCLD